MCILYKPVLSFISTDKIVELMEEVDNYIPEPQRDTEMPFLMPVEDVFSITERGTVARVSQTAQILIITAKPPETR